MSTPVDADCTPGFIWRDPVARTGPENMAVDEWLLKQTINSSHIQLRFYTWNRPTLSVGYFQEKTGLNLPERLQDIPVVRRLTGGGAILHDFELTYSLVLPSVHPQTHQPTGLYRLVHQALLQALSLQGISARFRGAEIAEKNAAFLCFLRGDRHDLLIGAHKILGSAQRRRKGAVLQHGSLLLQHSPLTADVPGLLDLTGQSLQVDQFCADLQNLLSPLATDWKSRETATVLDQAELQELLLKYKSPF